MWPAGIDRSRRRLARMDQRAKREGALSCQGTERTISRLPTPHLAGHRQPARLEWLAQHCGSVPRAFVRRPSEGKRVWLSQSLCCAAASPPEQAESAAEVRCVAIASSRAETDGCFHSKAPHHHHLLHLLYPPFHLLRPQHTAAPATHTTPISTLAV